jgi:conjugative transfer signal peptidase TraF
MTIAGLFDGVQNVNRRLIQRAVGVTAVAFTAPFFIAGAVGIRINASTSLPLGIYKETPDFRAPLIEFCPPEPYGSFAASRGYRSLGNCPDRAAPLMKPVVAKPGDIVDVSSLGITVNGVLLPNTAPKSKDSEGRPMQPWTLGNIEFHQVSYG